MSENVNSDYFLLLWHDPENRQPVVQFHGESQFLRGSKLLENITTVKMSFVDAKSKHQAMDYMGPDPLFSKRMEAIFNELNIDYLQTVPVEMEGYKGEIYPYFYLRICKQIRCIDIPNSDCQYLPERDKLRRIKSFKLDSKILLEIPLEDRLVFKPVLNRGERMFHKSVVDKIMSVEPTGIRFIKVGDWSEGMQFEH